MKITDFKKMTEKHIESCQKLIKQNGSCAGVICEHCPFYFENTVNGTGCYEYADQHYNPAIEKDELLTKNAKEFIELYNNRNIKVDEKRNLDMNMFTMEFGKMTVPTDEHLDKVEEEYDEFRDAYEDYEEAKYENMHPEDIEDYRKEFCLEALDMVQASISFVSHLIEEGIMTNEDIEAWKEKLEKRKEKYLK